MDEFKSKKPAGSLDGASSKQPLTRRDFLRVTEIVCAGTVISTLPGLRGVLAPFRQAASPSDEEIAKALELASRSDMFQEALRNMQSLGIKFELSPSFVKTSSWQEDYLGLVLGHSRSSGPRMGADLMLTLQWPKGILATLQSIVGWSLLDILVLTSSILDKRRPPEPEIRSPRVTYQEPPRMIWPHVEHHWSFSRPDSPPWRPEDASIEIGWPPETPDTHYWHYGGCNDCEWMNDKGVLVYRSIRILEERFKETEQLQTVDLRYG